MCGTGSPADTPSHYDDLQWREANVKSKTALLTCLNKRSLLNDPDAGERETHHRRGSIHGRGDAGRRPPIFLKGAPYRSMEEILSRALQEGDLFLYRAAAECSRPKTGTRGLSGSGPHRFGSG